MIVSSASARSKADFTCSVDTREIMIFTETPLVGAYLIDLEKRGDERASSLGLSARKSSPVRDSSLDSPRPITHSAPARAPCAACTISSPPRPRPRSSAASVARSMM